MRPRVIPMVGAVFPRYDGHILGVRAVAMKRRFKAGRRPSKARPPKLLKREGRNVSKPHASPFSADELTRLTRERDEALEQQAATSEVLKVISRSPGDLQPVFATMLAEAVRVCEANFGNIYRWDQDALHTLQQLTTLRLPLLSFAATCQFAAL